jgi:hypothetical protein
MDGSVCRSATGSSGDTNGNVNGGVSEAHAPTVLTFARRTSPPNCVTKNTGTCSSLKRVALALGASRQSAHAHSSGLCAASQGSTVCSVSSEVLKARNTMSLRARSVSKPMPDTSTRNRPSAVTSTTPTSDDSSDSSGAAGLTSATTAGSDSGPLAMPTCGEHEEEVFEVAVITVFYENSVRSKTTTRARPERTAAAAVMMVVQPPSKHKKINKLVCAR